MTGDRVTRIPTTFATAPEAMEKYNPTAYRFLLTAREPRELPSDAVEPYDPATDDGPLRKSGDKWYWNGNFTSEFMIDDDLPLGNATGLNFVSHHPQYCRTFGNPCAERKENPTWDKTGGRILAYILAHELTVLNKHLKPTQENPRNQLLDTAFTGLHAALTEDGEFGGSLTRPASCKKVATGALALYGMDQVDSALDLLTVLKSADGFDTALLEIIRDHFGAPDWTAPF